jgi:tRNA-dihydrouridine synthase B
MVRMLEYTGCAAVTAARGALGNPWIFREAQLVLNGASQDDVRSAAPSVRARADMFLRQLDLTAKAKGEYVAVREMRKAAGLYFKGLPGVTKLRNTVNKLETAQSMSETINAYAESLSEMDSKPIA